MKIAFKIDGLYTYIQRMLSQLCTSCFWIFEPTMLSIHNLDNIYRKAVETEMSANAYSNSIIIH